MADIIKYKGRLFKAVDSYPTYNPKKPNEFLTKMAREAIKSLGEAMYRAGFENGGLDFTQALGGDKKFKQVDLNINWTPEHKLPTDERKEYSKKLHNAYNDFGKQMNNFNRFLRGEGFNIHYIIKTKELGEHMPYNLMHITISQAGNFSTIDEVIESKLKGFALTAHHIADVYKDIKELEELKDKAKGIDDNFFNNVAQAKNFLHKALSEGKEKFLKIAKNHLPNDDYLPNEYPRF